MPQILLTISLQSSRFLLPISGTSPISTLLPLALKTYTSTLLHPPSTPSSPFTWLVFLGDVILPNDCLVGDVCSKNTVLEIKPVLISNKENVPNKVDEDDSYAHRNGVNSVESVYSEVVHRVSNLSLLLTRVDEDTPSVSNSVSLILSLSDSSLPSIAPLRNLLKYALSVSDVDLTFKVLLKVMKSKLSTTDIILSSVKQTFDDKRIKAKVSIEQEGFLEVVYELLAINDDGITECVLDVLSKFHDSNNGRSSSVTTNSKASSLIPNTFYSKLINVRPPREYSEYTNVLLSMILAFYNLKATRLGGDVGGYVGLRNGWKGGGGEVGMCWRECSRRILRGRRKDYEEEVNMRYEERGILERWYERWQGEEEVAVLPKDKWRCEDRVLLTYLKILREVGGEDEEVCLACCALKGLGEMDGDWARIEKEEEELLGREEREWNITERTRSTSRIHILTAIRTVAGCILAGAENFKPSLQAGVLLMKSLGTIGKAVGCNILGQEDVSLTESDVRELMKTCLYQGGTARIEALKCLATLSQNGGGRRIILTANGVHVISTVLIAAVEGSVGEENFYIEREIVRPHDDTSLTSKYYENNPANLNTIERCCARILVHLAAAGDKERDEIAQEVHALKLTDDVAKELIDVILDD
ncbi:hypothetical protein TrST_g3133 [Triparma strigata]|uniref:Uncharacterized protein n=1 Tax=Triparma strigata TaxID=1606541 RepID=A0A9W7C945_9STRA|nr:hypothetical protein TrST_g3133 [Triparma strigata]